VWKRFIHVINNLIELVKILRRRILHRSWKPSIIAIFKSKEFVFAR